MYLSDVFIRRPIATTLVMAAILFFGIISYGSLPVSDLPNVDFPTIQVTANVPGASPETMASAVATPLEKQFSTMAGLDAMTSESAQGRTRITLQFALSRDIDAAAQDVQSAIAKAQRQLPQNMPSPPSYQKVNPADQPVLYLALVSPTLPLSVVDEYAQSLIAQRISMVSGVAQVSVYGSQKHAVRIQLMPGAMTSMGVGLDEVGRAVEKGNVNLPTGTLSGPEKSFTVSTEGQLKDAEAYKPLIIAYRQGAPVRLEQIANVISGVENDKVASWFNQDRGIVLAIQRQPGTNTVEVVESIKRLLPSFRSQLPASVNLNVLFDRSVSIKDSVHDVKFTLMLALCLVVLVIFLFLRNLSATVIPSLALPLSIIGTFSVMHVLDYSLDNMSLMALTLAVGFVVDDAIVMLENIVRHIESGEQPLEAAIKGSKEIGFTILSMTISLVAVFIPVMFMGGIMGRLLHEFAVTISAAVLISGFVSLTLTPMMCSRFLKPHPGIKRNRLYDMSERFFNLLLSLYDRSLKRALMYPKTVLMASMIMLVAAGYLYKIMPKGFLPSEDTGQIFAFTEGAQGISFDAMKEHQRSVAAIVAQDPNVDSFMSSIGAAGASASVNSGRLFIRLKTRDKRKAHVDEVIRKLRPKLSSVPGIRVYMQNLPPIRLGGTLTKSSYQFTLQSPDTDVLYESAQRFETGLKNMPELMDVTSDLMMTNPQINIAIDRDRASALGLTAFEIEDALYSAYASRQISTIYAPNNAYQVIMEVSPEYQTGPSVLSMLHIRSSSGNLVPLGSVAEIKTGVGPLTVNHMGQIPAVNVSFNVREGVSLSEAMEKVRASAKETLPDTVTSSFQGTAQAFESSFKGLGILLLMAVLVIYIVLGILYESFVHPITILSGLPSAGLGALLTLMIFDMEMSVYAFVGVIMLVGIVKKNAIMMIDFALSAQRNENKPPAEAIYQGCIIRFRPIMMTTMAALMGTLPIALGAGAGAESRRPLGMAVVGGLVFSQIITLYITPVIYVYMDKLQTAVRGWFARRPKEGGTGI